jgi:hypothetical protein
MKFHGLFVGIDRYASPRISNLTCASRDPAALYALFVDTFDAANSVLLSNEQATSIAIRTEVESRLASSGVADAAFVVNYRSGRPLWSREQLSQDLIRLCEHGLIEEEAGEYRLTGLGRVAGREGRRSNLRKPGLADY